MNKLQSFLTENLDLMQAIEPNEQLKIDGGCKPTLGPGGILQGDIGPITVKTAPILVQGPTQPTQHG